MKSQMNLSIPSIIVLILIGLCLSISAQTPAKTSTSKEDSRLATYLLAKPQLDELYRCGEFWDKRLELQTECNAKHTVLPINMFVLQPIELPGGFDHPVAGVWLHRFTFDRCGQQKIYNAIFMAKPGAPPKMSPYYPGETNASPQLVKDALKKAIAHIYSKRSQKEKNECDRVNVMDMKVLLPAGENNPAWIEQWQIRTCDDTFPVDIKFAPDGKGGTLYSIQK